MFSLNSAKALKPTAPPVFGELTKYDYSSSDSAKTLEVFNPATGKSITTLRVGDASVIDAAAVKAHNAQKLWARVPLAERGALMLQCADVIAAHADELATLLCTENGKPFIDARTGDLQAAERVFRFFGSLVDKLPTEYHDRGLFNAYTVREPYGVVVGILPFNWPPIHAAGKAAPAIAMGNAVILKPGEQAPLTVMRLVELLQTVLPEGLIQAIPGNGPEVPQALIKHPLVRFVSFTGSTMAGRKVSETAAQSLTPIVLELGGKNAFVVFEDADLDAAARTALEGGLFNKGEACTATSRVLVQASVHDTFVSKLAAAWKRVRIGDGMSADTHVGPQVSAAQQKRVLEYIEIGKSEGAKVEAQVHTPTDARLKDGYFVPPTLLTGVERTMRVAQEEIFGPVQTVTAFKDEPEALSIVNESPYGLTCTVFTRSMERASRAARLIEAGMVFVNNYSRGTGGLPFGGEKESGNTREHCVETLYEYSTSKVVQVPSGFGQAPSWRAVADVFDS